MVLSNFLLPALFLVSSAAALSPFLDSYYPRPHIPYVDEPDNSVSVVSFTGHKTLTSHDTIYYFDQLIDHNKPELGTFKQRYWHSEEFYEPGGPVILGTPGEIDASGFTGYLTNITISGMITQALHGTVVLLEHRFFGESNPYGDLSVESLQVHTIQQALDDLEYFAKNVVLPMDGGDELAPEDVPWILVGGSYSGALVSYAVHSKPNVFWAAYASSAVVQAKGHFWSYFEPIREHMPKNCSNDIEATIAYIDATLESGDPDQVWAIKQNFGLGTITHNDDFAAAIRTPLFHWQDNDITHRSEKFFDFCDALEVNEEGEKAPESGWGVDHTLRAWGTYWNTTYYKSLCGSSPASSCYNSWNPSAGYLNNVTLPSSSRSWKWLTCNEFGFFHTGAPEDSPTLVSRFLTADHSERDCQHDFPEAFKGRKQNAFLNALGVNRKFMGWNNRADRIIFVNGERDPWREATVAAVNAPPTYDDYLQPHLLGDGFHCSDMKLAAAVSPRIRKIQDLAISRMIDWFQDWQWEQDDDDDDDDEESW